MFDNDVQKCPHNSFQSNGLFINAIKVHNFNSEHYVQNLKSMIKYQSMKLIMNQF